MFPINGPGATVDNKFTEGDPISGVPATVVTANFMNDVQAELLNILTAAGVAPAQATPTQVLTALQRLSQNQAGVTFATSGTATAQVLTPAPAIDAYAVGQRFNVRFNVASGVNPTINISGKGAKPLKQYDASGNKTSAVFAAGQVADIVYDGTDAVLLGAAVPAVRQGVRGAALGLKGVNSGTSATISRSWTRLTVEDASGSAITLGPAALTLNTAATGPVGAVGGMATGATAASTFYAVYAWYNPTTAVTLLTGDSSFTAPTAPAAGYTHWARISQFQTDASGGKLPLGMIQNNSLFQWKVAPATNVLGLPRPAFGAQGSVSVPTYIQISMAAYLPPTAVAVGVIGHMVAANGSVLIAPNGNYGAHTSVTNPAPIDISNGSGQANDNNSFAWMLLETQNLYYAALDNQAYLTLTCFEDDL